MTPSPKSRIGHRKPKVSPPRTVERTESPAKPSTQRVECGKCEKLYLGGAIVNHPVQHDPDQGEMVMIRAIYCDHCDHLQTWVEAVDHNDRPTGYIFEGPYYITARDKVDRFLREHPEARGVSQS